MENPSSWDEVTKLIWRTIQAHEAALEKNEAWLSLPRRIRDALVEGGYLKEEVVDK